MVNEVMFKSESDEWGTPVDLFNYYHRIFKFGLDVCATKENAKCKDFYDKEANGLIQPWANVNFMNPPYGRKITDWIKKACFEQNKGNTTVALLPARVDTRWFHEYIYMNDNVSIKYLKGRLKFHGANNSAPFPSMIVIFWGNRG